MSQPIAVLLAGGESRRMGTPKALLDFHGRPLWQHLHERLLAAGCERVLVSGHFPQDIPGAIPDLTPGTGPLGGIAAVVAALGPARTGTLLVTPVDLPLLDVPVLRNLLTQHPEAAAMHYATHALPARYRLDAAFRAALAACLADPDPRRRSMQSLAATLQAAVLPLDAAAAAALVNANTPEEWQQVLRLSV
ncbi:MAG: molybdenum cofactor guanylyltransferase [Pseudomonadota bacterium]